MAASIEGLVDQVERLEDYEASADALAELVRRDPAVGARLAGKLLTTQAGDVYFRAFAFDLLYGADRTQAFAFIRSEAGRCETYLFRTMLDEVADDVGLLQESPELQQIVDELRATLSHRSDREDPAVRESIAVFLRLYGDGTA